jgi:hypothetical protein
MKLTLSPPTVYEMCMHSWDTPTPSQMTAPLPTPLPDSTTHCEDVAKDKEQQPEHATHVFVTLRAQLRAAKREIFDLTASLR